ncbi:hypothetical protein BJF78_26495 [Pseudonocardia sp. CNS-139]|nr:hypothetical protein BJF78_26495 [Pseudonocardia sp. CNS-139]
MAQPVAGNVEQLYQVLHEQLVAAMAREAGRLAQEAGDPAAESVLRELQGILDAALAVPSWRSRSGPGG